MNQSRRTFLKCAAGTGALAFASRRSSAGPMRRPSLAQLDRAAAAPVLHVGSLTSPVKIASVELLRNGRVFLVRIRSTDGAEGPDRLQRELERTDRLIERAREAIGDSDLPEAIRALERATNLQQDAWAAFRAEKFRVALAATREARNLAAYVLKLVRGPVSTEQVQRGLSETDRLLDRATEIFEGPVPSPYMLFTHRVRPGWRERIPAVVHVDGTARIIGSAYVLVSDPQLAKRAKAGMGRGRKGPHHAARRLAVPAYWLLAT